MAFSNLVGVVDDAVLDAFGEDVTFTPQAPPSTPQTVKAIVDDGAQPEGASPGVYVVLSVRAALITPDPERNDQFTINGKIYKIFKVERDVMDLMTLTLKFHRDVV